MAMMHAQSAYAAHAAAVAAHAQHAAAAAHVRQSGSVASAPVAYHRHPGISASSSLPPVPAAAIPSTVTKRSQGKKPGVKWSKEEVRVTGVFELSHCWF